MDTTRFSYVGPPRGASALAQSLKMRGITANYIPPPETKDLATTTAIVSVLFSATGPIPAIVTCVREFTARTGTRVEGLPIDEASKTSARLALLDQLKSEGVISGEEHAHRRAQIISEL